MDSLPVKEFWYDLPDERIAYNPLPDRDQSKLLIYRKGEIEHSQFRSIADHLPNNTFLFFNDTKVIPARLHFKKETGAHIEIFLLSPLKPSTLHAKTMESTRSTTWLCTIGNLKRWKEDSLLLKKIDDLELTATLVDREKGIVKFNWSPEDVSFAQVLASSGVTPLPPYIKREAEKKDLDRYQTIYSQYDGAVAAPTAGLHFSDHVFTELEKRGIKKDFLTLHVSAGTFQPIKDDDALQHSMHSEQVVVTKQNIENLIQHSCIVPVGTTSMRTLESLYWYGVKLLKNPDAEFMITQHDPYHENQKLPEKGESLDNILWYMNRNNLSTIQGNTSIYIHPGYDFKICKGLITNFHLPGSTLMLLVAALIGKDWKEVYNQALINNYRFLSYGDSSLLLP